MGDDWRANLATLFEETRIIQSSQREAQENFDQFCEFVAEPAFESMGEELEQFGIRSHIRQVKGRSIGLQINFPGSRIDHFHYIIVFPRNSLELKLRLQIKGRAGKRRSAETSEESFMPEMGQDDVLKLEKGDLIEDVIEHLRSFNFKALTSPD